MTQELSNTDLQTVFLRTQDDLKLQIRRRVRCPETAADLTQDLFLRLDRLRDNLVGEDHARKYLRRMASNIALDHIRVEANRTRILKIAEPLFDRVESPTFAEAHEAREQIEVLLSLLTPRQRDILMLSRGEEQPYTAIAHRLSISTSLVEKEVAAAMRILTARAALYNSSRKRPAKAPNTARSRAVRKASVPQIAAE